jgi:hypothetical protein
MNKYKHGIINVCYELEMNKKIHNLAIKEVYSYGTLIKIEYMQRVLFQKTSITGSILYITPWRCAQIYTDYTEILDVPIYSLYWLSISFNMGIEWTKFKGHLSRYTEITHARDNPRIYNSKSIVDPSENRIIYYYDNGKRREETIRSRKGKCIQTKWNENGKIIYHSIANFVYREVKIFGKTGNLISHYLQYKGVIMINY